MDKYKLSCLTVGMAQVNCYFLKNIISGELVIIDPGAESSRLKTQADQLGGMVQGILLTHGHFDHVGAAQELAEQYQAATYLGEQDRPLAEQPELNCGALFGVPCSFCAGNGVTDREKLTLAGMEFQVIHTPGHTAGGVCYYLPEMGILFSGDTLFFESVGRTDFPTGREEQLLASVTDRLFCLPEETVVYPGHGAHTTIGYEKKNNPFFQGEGIWK